MSTGAIVNMIFILSIVVGGFIYFVRMAARKEKSKSTNKDQTLS